MIYRNELKVSNEIIPESSGYHSGAVEGKFLPKCDAGSVNTRFWKILTLEKKAPSSVGTRSFDLHSDATPPCRRAEYGFSAHISVDGTNSDRCF